MSTLRIVCLSDTHNLHAGLVVPEGDLLIHSGDFTGQGTPKEIEAFGDWLATQPHEHKVVVAGNHDFLFERDRPRAEALLGEVHYLQDQGLELLGLRLWGSPWTPEFHDWAFNLPRGQALADKWALIPEDTDLLITHGPPMGLLDRTCRGLVVGCEDLREAAARVRPALHVFGHIHEEYGVLEHDSMLLVNACNCSFRYKLVNAPTVIDWEIGVGPRAVSVNGEH